MTVLELFQKWKKEQGKCNVCGWAAISGGSGYIGFDHCENENHKTVRYGSTFCPNNCSDFYEKTENVIFSEFIHYYKDHAKYLNKEYDISPCDYYYFNPEDRPIQDSYFDRIRALYEREQHIKKLE